MACVCLGEVPRHHQQEYPTHSHTKRDHIILPLLLIKVSVDARLEGSGVLRPPPPNDDEDARAAIRLGSYKVQ